MSTNRRLEQLLGEIFDGAREGLRESITPAEYEKRKRDFIFHMTDWNDDLKDIISIIEHPEQQDEGSASPLIIGFLYHVIPHLNAAGRLLLDDVGDPFSQSLPR